MHGKTFSHQTWCRFNVVGIFVRMIILMGRSIRMIILILMVGIVILTIRMVKRIIHTSRMTILTHQDDHIPLGWWFWPLWWLSSWPSGSSVYRCWVPTQGKVPTRTFLTDNWWAKFPSDGPQVTRRLAFCWRFGVSINTFCVSSQMNDITLFGNPNTFLWEKYRWRQPRKPNRGFYNEILEFIIINILVKRFLFVNSSWLVAGGSWPMAEKERSAMNHESSFERWALSHEAWTIDNS